MNDPSNGEDLLAPTSRVLVVLLFVVTVALLRTRTALIEAAMMSVLALVASRSPPGLFAKRFGAALPFIAFAALSAYFSDNSLEKSALMALRISSSVTALITLTLVLPFHQLLAALQRLHMPRLMVLLLLFTHRYIHVFTSEMERMRMARRARGFTGGRHLFDRRGMDTISATVGMIFVRALGRGTNIAQAMRMRGLRDRFRMPPDNSRERWSAIDVVFFSLVLVICTLLLLQDMGRVGTGWFR